MLLLSCFMFNNRHCLAGAAPGMVTSLQRKQRIYEICSENDIVIIEDDPYYYLQYSLGSGTHLHTHICIFHPVG